MADTEDKGGFFERLGDLSEDRLVIRPNTELEDNGLVLNNIDLWNTVSKA